GAENVSADLRDADACHEAVAGATYVFNLAADMGGMGFIETHKADCMVSVLINTHMLVASREAGVEHFLYGSSACVYAADKQTDPAVTALRESDAYPAMPEDGYGWEKLFGERLCRHFTEDFGMETRVARFHNVYGPHGTWEGGREKAPAAMCRKVLEAIDDGSLAVEVWGDGAQTRSFLYVDDCIDGTLALMASDVGEPLNIGSEELVTIDGLVDLVSEVAGIEVEKRHRLDRPRGVMGRNSDNTRARTLLGFEPKVSLREGIERTFWWIAGERAARQRGAAADRMFTLPAPDPRVPVNR
ncbi:MAG TPA: NAD-dependent epimerase/dehydratase family protein, partial [Acetobacteraceae bacterium]|nr:NAD-dependent epimerase/dehydratase family protein [Acetobacteraceae bacterium]